jgi:hypothetical protein
MNKIKTQLRLGFFLTKVDSMMVDSIVLFIYKKRQGGFYSPQIFSPHPWCCNFIYKSYLFHGSLLFTHFQRGAPINAPATNTTTV